MIGRWKINIEGSPKEGGTLGYYTCSCCNKTYPATQMPDDDINYCPRCGADMREKGSYTRAEVLMHNMSELIDNYQCRTEPDEAWWENEYGSDLTDMVDCHVVFEGEPPCLLEKRGIDFTPNTMDERFKRDAACAECKAIWLMEVYD